MVEIVVHTEAMDHLVAFNVAVMHKGKPENKTGHPDTWTPAEGADWEPMEAFLVRGKRRRRLNPYKLSMYLDGVCPTWAHQIDLAVG